MTQSVEYHLGELTAAVKMLSEGQREIKTDLKEVVAVRDTALQNAQAIGGIQATLKRHNINGGPAKSKTGSSLTAWVPVVNRVVNYVFLALFGVMLTYGLINIDALTTLWSLAQGQLGSAQ